MVATRRDRQHTHTICFVAVHLNLIVALIVRTPPYAATPSLSGHRGRPALVYSRYNLAVHAIHPHNGITHVR